MGALLVVWRLFSCADSATSLCLHAFCGICVLTVKKWVWFLAIKLTAKCHVSIRNCGFEKGAGGPGLTKGAQESFTKINRSRLFKAVLIKKNEERSESY